MRHALLLALLCHLVLAGGYWLITPALEAPREEDHVARASACARGHGLHDAYSTLLALGLHAAAMPDLRVAVVPAPEPGALRLAHGNDEPRGSAEQRLLAALRALSVLLGLGSLGATFAIARTAFPASGVAAVALPMMACMPQWASSHAVLWHGALLGAAVHTTVWLAVRGAARGRFTQREGLAAGAAAGLALWTAAEGWFAAAGAAAGLALWTAAEGWFAAAVAVLAHLAAISAQPRERSTWRSLAALALLAGVGWSLGRAAPPLLPLPPSGRGAKDLLHSFVGEFGRHALPLPWPPIAITLVILGSSVLGWLLGAARLAPSRPALRVLAASCSLGTVAGVSAALRDDYAGRALLIAFGPMAVLTAAGIVAAWRSIAPGAIRPWASHPAAVLLPFVPSLLVLVLQVAPRARVTPSGAAGFVTLRHAAPDAAHRPAPR